MAADDQEPRNQLFAPPNSELAERIARVDEKQQATLETVERIEDNLDSRLSEVEKSERKVDRLWLVLQGGKWLVATGAATGGVAALITLL